MSRRKTPSQRRKQSERNKKNTERVHSVSPKAVLLQKARQRRQQRRSEELATAYANVMVEVSKAYYEGKVKYSALRAVDVERGKVMQKMVEERTAEYARLPKSEQTREVLRKVGEIVQSLNQNWIDAGDLRVEDIQLGQIPTARIYEDGRIEAVNRATDIDILDMGKRFRQRIESLK